MLGEVADGFPKNLTSRLTGLIDDFQEKEPSGASHNTAADLG